MKVLTIKSDIDEYVDNNLAVYFQKGNLYPFLGAGFTMGSKAMRNKVPDGKECMDLMKKIIISANPEYLDISEENDFDQVANLFYSVVPKDHISDFIFENFTNVKLEKNKKDFLNLNWPYIYTLNIDDAIESNASYKIILPNNKIARKYLTTGTVFKLHGDAHSEVLYIKNYDGIIFSRSQYLKSINQNKDLLDIFLEDYTSQNILLIGCSLSNELDIEYLLANNEMTTHKISDKIYITSAEPKGSKKIKLQNFGINIVIVVENYNSFYENLTQKFTNLQDWNAHPFENFLIKDFIEKDEQPFNKNIVLGDTELNILNNKVDIPSFFINRNVLHKAINLLETEDMIFVIGKRVSGKTFFLHSIAKSIKNKNVYLFPSRVSIDSNLIDRLIELKNSIIIFDSDTIQSYDVEDIYYRISDFTANDIKFIFCINSSDRLMLSIPYTRVIDREIIEIDSYLKENEVKELNPLLSKFAIPNFKIRDNILNNIIQYKEIYRDLDSDIFNVIKGLDSKSLKIFVLSAVFDKVYSITYRTLGIDQDNLNFAINLSRKSIELEHDIESLERGQHASFKVITNSKSYLFSCLGEFIQTKNNITSAVTSIYEIVSKLKSHSSYQNTYKAIIAFDTLNQIFYKRGNGGAINLIFLIYEKLEELLYQDSHYWMQRAKSIFYLKRNNIPELLKAIQFAKKPYYDSEPFTRLNMNASYQISMIYIRIATLQEYKNVNTLKEAAKWTSLTLQETSYNNKVIQNLVDGARREQRKNEFYNFSSYIMNNKSLVERNHAEVIIYKVFNFQI